MFGTLCDFLRACIQKPFRRLTDRHTDERRDANRKGRTAHIKRRKRSQGAVPCQIRLESALNIERNNFLLFHTLWSFWEVVIRRGFSIL